jgi:hypothetical protein
MWAMRPSRSVPDGYVAAGSVTLAGNRRLNLTLNLVGIPWMAVCAVGYVLLAALVRPADADVQVGQSRWLLPVLVGGMLFVVVAVVVLHEAAHGLAFWVFTGSRPSFGIKGWYAYAAAPGWHLSRGRYLCVLLAPIVLFTVVGLPLVALAPPVAAILVVLALIGNATSAIGDLYMCLRLIGAGGRTVVEDRSDGIAWYVPAPPAAQP